jgi:hypothetical protein
MNTQFKALLAFVILASPIQAAWAVGLCSKALTQEVQVAKSLDSGTYILSTEKRLMLAKLLEANVKSYESWSFDRLFNELKQTVEASSIETIQTILKDHPADNLLTRDDLAQMVGYVQFLKEVGIDATNMPLELRIEGKPGKEKAYLLTDLKFSLIQKVGDQKYVWSHEAGWAKERFLENISKVYLCGQFMGMSKFVTLGTFGPKTTKEQVLQKLGLKGYPDFDKPGPFYLITANPKDRAFTPKVPLLYKWIGNDGKFEIATNFGKDSIPGFTSGGMSEVIMPTFTVEAANLVELGNQGVSVRVFEDQP